MVFLAELREAGIVMDHIDDKYVSALKKNNIYFDTHTSFKKKYLPDENELLYISVFAPTAIEFVRWILIDSLQKGIKRLYFLARDAYSMYVVANLICRHYNLDIECRYLRVSRYAMRIPEYHLIGKQCIDRICVGGIDVTFRKVLMRAGFSGDEIAAAAKECGYQDKCEEILNYSQISALKDIFRTNDKLLEKIYDISKKEYNTAVGYLKQEGLFDDVDYALVDSGWIGTLQQSIRNLLRSAGRKKNLLGYYFGMYEVPRGENIADYRCFYFSSQKGLHRKVYFSNCLFEVVFSAPDGMTLGYEKHDDKFTPVYLSEQNPNAALIGAQIKSLENYTKIWLNNVKDITGDIDYAMVKKLLRRCMGSPSYTEAKLLGSCLFSDDVLENSMKPAAAKLSWEDIRNQRLVSRIMIMLGIKKRIIHESAWIEGSVVCGGKNVKSSLRHIRLYKYFAYFRKQLKSS